MSHEINEEDLNRLECLTTTHLQCYQLYFNLLLKPKHHFLLHYGHVIRSMGPVINFWAMRMEAKHQYFKKVVHNTRNFVNTKKTLAQKHQEKFAFVQSRLTDEINFGKAYSFVESKEFQKYNVHLESMGFTENTIHNFQTVKSLKINDRFYKPGFLIASDNQFFKIQSILSFELKVFSICTESYDVVAYDAFLNGLRIISSEKVKVIEMHKLKNIKPYEKKCVGGNVYVIADCLASFKMNKN